MNRSYHLPSARVRQSGRQVLLGGAMLVTVAGLLAPPAAMADGCENFALYAGMSANARSIALIEGSDPANCSTVKNANSLPMSPTHRSIVLIEGRDPANFPAIAGDSSHDAVVAGVQEAPVPELVCEVLALDAGLSANARSIALIEGTDPANCLP